MDIYNCEKRGIPSENTSLKTKLFSKPDKAAGKHIDRWITGRQSHKVVNSQPSVFKVLRDAHAMGARAARGAYGPHDLIQNFINYYNKDEESETVNGK